ncbi:SURF6-domain-containing protein [Venturia nashicola]|nr:SURF6-domain-containing protein [Venturia nashicola]
MADKDLEARLKSHSRAFEGLLSLIPADLYYEKDRSDQWEKKKQTPEERRSAKKAKLNPANHRTAKDVMDENERKRRREEGEEVEDEDVSDQDAPGKEKPLEGLKQKQPKNKVQKTKAEDDVHSKDEEEADLKDQNQTPKKSADEKRREKDQKRIEKRAKKEEKEKAKQARKVAATSSADSKTDPKSKDILNTTEDPDEEEDALDMDNDMEAVDVAGLVPNEEAATASDSSAADSTFSLTSNKIPSSNSSIVIPNTNGATKSDTNGSLSKNAADLSTSSTKAGKPSAAEKAALLARLQAKLEAHRKARNADGLNGQPAKNRHELIEARRLKAEKRKATKKELRQAEREQSKKAEMEAHLAELRGSPSIGSDMFGSRAGSMSPPQNSFSFGRVAFTDGETASSDLSKLLVNGKKKANSDPKAALQAAEKKQARLNSFDENKRADIEQKDLWLNAKKKVHGEKVRDDTSLLKKTLKRKEQEKAKSAKEWNERKEGISKSQEMKQKKRETNLQARKDGKGIKGKGSKGGKKSAPSKKKKRPGFEGSFSGRAK